MAHGNVESWLGELQVMQQTSLHGVIRDAANLIADADFELLTFIADYPAQVKSRMPVSFNYTGSAGHSRSG